MSRSPVDTSSSADERLQNRLRDFDLSRYRNKVPNHGSGTAGPEGPAGTAGTQIRQGTTVPSNALGVNGDYYLRTTTEDLYLKSEGTYSILVNLKGEKGETGAAGTNGTNGANGLSGTGAPIAARLATTAALSPTNTLTGNVLEATAVGILTVDGKTVAVNDQILVKNEAEGKKNGVYNVVTVGTASVKYKLERIAAMDTSAEAIPGQLVTVIEGSANAIEVYQQTTAAPITLNTTALTFARTAPRDYGVVEALPTSPTPQVGDVCTFKFGTGKVWQLRYTGEAEYPWVFAGGQPQSVFVEAATEAASATFLASGTELKPPLKGEYLAQHGSQVQLVGGPSSNFYQALFIAGTISNPTLGWMIGIDQFEGGSVVSAQVPITATKEAAITLRTQQFTNTVAWSFQRKWITLLPLRVG